MSGLTVYEFDTLLPQGVGHNITAGAHAIPNAAFRWLDARTLAASATAEARWSRLTQWNGRRAIQVTNYAGVIRTPEGFQLEILPKTGSESPTDATWTRQLFIDMLRCLGGFRHVRVSSARLVAARMPLLEVFIQEFLSTVERVVKTGLHSSYNTHRDNLPALRGKLQFASHLQQNLFRRDRFLTEFDEFTLNRPENRLLRTALARVLPWTRQHRSQQLLRQLLFAFVEVPLSEQPDLDFSKVTAQRSMRHYSGALAWARLILTGFSPLTGAGSHAAPSLLFPMEAVFEAFVRKHLQRQLLAPFTLHSRKQQQHLVTHRKRDLFAMVPDYVVRDGNVPRLVLDAKWKLLDSTNNMGSTQYGLSQSDFYQLYAYGQNWLNGQGDVVLIYPRTPSFPDALPVFKFRHSPGLRLWVLPFCLETRTLLPPPCGALDEFFPQRNQAAPQISISQGPPYF